MTSSLQTYLAAPQFQDPEKTRVARLLNTIVISSLVMTIVSAIFVLSAMPEWPLGMAHLLVFVFGLGVQILMRRGLVQLASLLFASATWLMILVFSLAFGGVEGVVFGALVVVVMTAGLLLGGRAGVGFALISIVAALAIYQLQRQGLYAPVITETLPSIVVATRVIYLAVAAVLLTLYTSSMVNALETARGHEVHLLQQIAEREQLEKAAALTKAEIERQNEQMESLYAIGKLANSMLDTDGILDLLTDEAMRVSRASHGQVLVVQPDGALRRRSLRGYSSEEKELAQRVSVPSDLGPSRRALATRRLVRLDDVQSEPGYPPLLLSTRAELAVPILHKGHILGALNLQSQQVGAFRDADLAYLSALVDQAAIALNNAQVYQEADRRLNEQRTLREASAIISSTLELGTVLSHIAEQMCMLVDTTSAYICELSSREMSYTVIAEYVSQAAGGKEKSSDLGAVYQAYDSSFLDAMAMGIYDTSHIDDPDLSDWDREHMAAFDAKTILYIPLLVRDELVGFAELWESRRVREFTVHEITLCEDIAQQAAIALQNARLYEQARLQLADRVRAERQLRSSLREKEVLLQEIHHRVKNNLQVIYSLLNLQSDYTSAPEAREILLESRNRVRAMALIHEKLYQSPDFSQVDFREYVRTLITPLSDTFLSDMTSPAIRVQGDSIYLGINQAVPCGLILNELVTNAIKHAFPPEWSQERTDQEPEIVVRLETEADGVISLLVQDNGIGLPAHAGPGATPSLGLELVDLLAKQLDGSIQVTRANGTAFLVRFPRID